MRTGPTLTPRLAHDVVRMEAVPRIVIDARGLGLAHAGRGIGRVIIELLRAFARIDALVEVAGPPVVRAHLVGAQRWLPMPARHWSAVLTPGRFPGLGRFEGDRMLRLAPTMPGPLDVMSVACLYDLMPLKEPDRHYALRTRLRHPLAWPAQRRAFDLFGRARRVWTISRQTAVDAERLLGIPRARLVPIPLAAPAWARPPSIEETRVVRARHGLPDAFVLWVLGGMNHNKNVDGMLRAVRARSDVLPLVVAGGLEGRTGAAFHAAVRKAGVTVRALGRVSDDDLRALLGAAACVAVPSRDEGFALPIAEALACGARVVANDIPVLRELAHRRVTYADANNAAAFAAALVETARTSDDPPAPPCTQRRSWDDVAHAVLALLDA